MILSKLISLVFDLIFFVKSGFEWEKLMRPFINFLDWKIWSLLFIRLLKFLKLPKFAELMQSESAKVSKTYSADSKKNLTLKKDSEISVLDVPKPNTKKTIV